MPIKDHEKYLEYQQGYHHNRWLNDPEYRRKQYETMKNFRLFKRYEENRLGKIEALIKLGGCCILCFETEPFNLEIHHPYGREKEPKVMVTICRSCHRKLDKRINNILKGKNKND